MNKHQFSIIFLFMVLTVLLTGPDSSGQESKPSGGAPKLSDTLSLDQVLAAVVQNHPSVKEAEEALNTADARIGLAKSVLYPNVDASANYTRIDPVSSFSFPIGGKTVEIQLPTQDNYSAGLNYSQVLYDFGKTSRNVAVEKESKTLASETVEQVKQKLCLAAASCYFTLSYLQKAIGIKDEQIKTLNEHLQSDVKKQATGSATEYQILTTRVKISGVESQKTDLENALRVQLTVLNTLLGEPESSIHHVTPDVMVSIPSVPADSAISFAYANREEIKIAREKESLAQLKLQMTKAQNFPVLSAFATGGYKNGYIPDLYALKANFTAGIGIRVPIFDGNRKKYNVAMAQSSIESAAYETDLAQRNITTEVIQARTNLLSSQKKVDLFTMQLKQAQQAFDLAKVSYASGAITNLELLDAETALADSELQLMKAKVDLSASLFQLKNALGLPLYPEKQQ